MVRQQYLRISKSSFCTKFQRTLAISNYVLTLTGPPPFYTGPPFNYNESDCLLSEFMIPGLFQNDVESVPLIL